MSKFELRHVLAENKRLMKQLAQLKADAAKMILAHAMEIAALKGTKE